MAAVIQERADYELGQAVLSQLKQKAELAERELSVEAEEGIITLRGLVKNRLEKGAAERTAIEVNGARAIISDIEIDSTPERADVLIARDILKEFRSHIRVPISRVKVIVSKGHVTLEGTLRSQFEKMLSEAAVKSVRGVKYIQNNIEVDPVAFSSREAQMPVEILSTED